jgi:hypothetical protein
MSAVIVLEQLVEASPAVAESLATGTTCTMHKISGGR